MAGEREKVWQELIALGEVNGPLAEDARAVARETMTRARTNIERLIELLPKNGYKFSYEPDAKKRQPYWAGDSAKMHEPPAKDVAKTLDRVEKLVGRLPLSLRAWWEVVGSVNMIGDGPEEWPSDIERDPLFMDPPLLQGIEYQWERWKEEEEEEEDDFDAEDCKRLGLDPDDFEGFWIDIAPDDYHKANCSGGNPYRIKIVPAADAKWDGANHDAKYFVGYLRQSFHWCGFAGVARLEKIPNSMMQVIERVRREMLEI